VTGVSGVLDNILHLSPLWLPGTAMLPVFLESAIFIGFLASGGDSGRAGRGRRLARLLLR
jgi:hypothetical protein